MKKNSRNFNGAAFLIIRNREHIFQFSFVLLTNELMRFRGLFYIFPSEVRGIISIGARRRRHGFPRRAHVFFFVGRLKCVAFCSRKCSFNFALRFVYSLCSTPLHHVYSMPVDATFCV